MTVRPAAMCDQSRVIALLRNYYEAGLERTPFKFEFEPAYAARLFTGYAGNKDACCLLLDVDGVAQGILMAAAYMHQFAAVKIASETLWWIEPQHRGPHARRMLDAYDDWARSRGCKYAGVAALQADAGVLRLYRRSGYQLAETHFLKAL